MAPAPLSCFLAGDLASAPARPALPEHLLPPAHPGATRHLTQPLGVHLAPGCIWAWGRAPSAGGRDGAEGSMVLIRHPLAGGAAAAARASVSLLPGACAAAWGGAGAVARNVHRHAAWGFRECMLAIQ